jgi:hypothetical protein
MQRKEDDEERKGTLVGCHSYLTLVLAVPPLLPAKRLNFMLTPGFGGGMTDAKHICRSKSQ